MLLRSLIVRMRARFCVPGASKHRARARNLSTFSRLSSARPCSLFRPHSACSWVCVVYEWFLWKRGKGVGLLLLQSCAELSERAANQSGQKGDGPAGGLLCAERARQQQLDAPLLLIQSSNANLYGNQPLCALSDNTNNTVDLNFVCLNRIFENCCIFKSLILFSNSKKLII